MRPSYHYNWNPYSGTMAYSYWNIAWAPRYFIEGNYDYPILAEKRNFRQDTITHEISPGMLNSMVLMKKEQDESL